MWFVYALIAGIFSAINSLLVRSYSKKHKDSLILSFCFSSIGALILLPAIIIMQPSIPMNPIFWGGIILISALVVIGNSLTFGASKYVGASTQNVINKLRLVGILICGIIIFSDTITVEKMIGMLFVITASLLIIDYKNWHASKKWIILLLINVCIGVIMAVLLKKLILMSEYILVAFLLFFVPALINATVIPNFIKRLKDKIPDIKPIILITILGVVFNLALIKALSYKELSGIYFVMEGAIILVVFGEHFILKEKERLGWKIAAIILAIAGAILLQI
jgi:drug/metabolite transporter (DMT)-like permease